MAILWLIREHVCHCIPDMLKFLIGLYRANYSNLTKVIGTWSTVFLASCSRKGHMCTSQNYGKAILAMVSIWSSRGLLDLQSASKRHLVGHWKESNGPWPGPAWLFYILGSVTWCWINWKEVLLTKLWWPSHQQGKFCQVTKPKNSGFPFFKNFH